MPFDTLKDLLPVVERRIEPVLPLGQSERAGENVAGVRRIRAQDQAAAALCVGRQRQPASARHRNAQAARRHRPAARALSRRRAGRHGDGRGRDHGRAGRRLQRGAAAGRASCAALATTGKKRSPLFPDMPTIAEFYPGYDLTIWLGLFAPAGDARADRDQAARGGAEGAGRSASSPRSSTSPARWSRCLAARRIRRADPARLREVRQAGERRRREDGLMRRLHINQDLVAGLMFAAFGVAGLWFGRRVCRSAPRCAWGRATCRWLLCWRADRCSASSSRSRARLVTQASRSTRWHWRPLVIVLDRGAGVRRCCSSRPGSRSRPPRSSSSAPSAGRSSG